MMVESVTETTRAIGDEHEDSVTNMDAQAPLAGIKSTRTTSISVPKLLPTINNCVSLAPNDDVEAVMEGCDTVAAPMAPICTGPVLPVTPLTVRTTVADSSPAVTAALPVSTRMLVLLQP